MSKGNVADEYWNALNAAYMTAQDVYNDMNSTQKEIDLQVKALQAAVDAVETQVVDKTELNALIEKATAEANRTDVVYTSATLEALKQRSQMHRQWQQKKMLPRQKFRHR